MKIKQCNLLYLLTLLFLCPSSYATVFNVKSVEMGSSKEVSLGVEEKDVVFRSGQEEILRVQRKTGRDGQPKEYKGKKYKGKKWGERGEKSIPFYLAQAEGVEIDAFLLDKNYLFSLYTYYEITEEEDSRCPLVFFTGPDAAKALTVVHVSAVKYGYTGEIAAKEFSDAEKLVFECSTTTENVTLKINKGSDDEEDNVFATVAVTPIEQEGGSSTLYTFRSGEQEANTDLSDAEEDQGDTEHSDDSDDRVNIITGSSSTRSDSETQGEESKKSLWKNGVFKPVAVDLTSGQHSSDEKSNPSKAVTQPSTPRVSNEKPALHFPHSAGSVKGSLSVEQEESGSAHEGRYFTKDPQETQEEEAKSDVPSQPKRQRKQDLTSVGRDNSDGEIFD